jgi:CheY-like chemotaxis protein
MIEKSAVKIMVVDDEPFMLKLHARALSNLGFTAVTTCEGALRALQAIDNAATPPDLILLDLNMPELDGVEFMRLLVKRGYPGSLILVSGEDERMLQAAEMLVQAHQITMLGHMRKPVKPAMFAALLETWKPHALAAHWPPAGLGETAAVKKAYAADKVRAAIADGELVN